MTASCSDWNDIETVGIDNQHAQDQNPELWARYLESLRVYKKERPHYITYASFANGIKSPVDEGDFLLAHYPTHWILSHSQMRKI